jgi:hypothetical protein
LASKASNFVYANRKSQHESICSDKDSWA